MRLPRLAIASDDYLNEVRDDEGRPLGEMRASHRAAVDMTLRPCPYAGTRHGLPMATASLKQVSKHWDAVLGALASIRGHYVSRGATLPLSSFDIWRIGKTAESVPAFMLSRADRPSQLLPATTAALFKSILGINAALSLRFVKWLLHSGSGPSPATATLLEHSETHGWLVGDQRVCAGSEAMMHRVLDVLANGGVAPSRAAATALPDDAEALHEYAHHLMRLALLLELIEVAAGLVASDMLDALGAQRACDATYGRGAADGLARFVATHHTVYSLRERDADSRSQALRRVSRTLHVLDDGSEPAAAMKGAADRVPPAWAEPSAAGIAKAGMIVGIDSLERCVVNGLPLARMVALWASFERIAMLAARSTERALASVFGETPPVIALAQMQRPRATAPIRRAFRDLFGVTARHQASGTLITAVAPGARRPRLVGRSLPLG